MMDRRISDNLRKHGARALGALPVRQTTISLTCASDGRTYLWVTERHSCRIANR